MARERCRGWDGWWAAGRNREAPNTCSLRPQSEGRQGSDIRKFSVG